jgi:hypothetical protein
LFTLICAVVTTHCTFNAKWFQYTEIKDLLTLHFKIKAMMNFLQCINTLTVTLNMWWKIFSFDITRFTVYDDNIEVYLYLDKVLETYTSHPCRRSCIANKTMTCSYDFTLELYFTLSKACYNCPINKTDCSRPHCIAADGVPRGVLVVNRMLPGPGIHVSKIWEMSLHIILFFLWKDLPFLLSCSNRYLILNYANI